MRASRAIWHKSTSGFAVPVRLSIAKGTSNTTTAAWGATSGAASPTAGNLLVVGGACQNGSSNSNSAGSFSAGWSVVNGPVVSNGAARAQAWIAYKVAAGADAAPTFVITGANTTVTIAEEWSGLAASSPFDIAYTGGTQVSAGTVHAGPNSTTFDGGGWNYAAMSGRSGTLSSWGGGQSDDDLTSNTASNQLWTSTGNTAAAGSYDPQATVSAGILSLIAVAFKRLAL